MLPDLRLVPKQHAHLRQITDNGATNFAGACDYLCEVLQKGSFRAAAAGVAYIGPYGDIIRWLMAAADVLRDNRQSAMNLTMRSVLGQSLAGSLAMDEGAAERVAVEVAEHVTRGLIRTVLRRGVIPGAARFLQRDLAATEWLAGATIGGWAGAMWFWDVPLSADPYDTVGHRIERNAREYENFLALNARAARAAAAALGCTPEDVLGSLEVRPPIRIKELLAGEAGPAPCAAPVTPFATPEAAAGDVLESRDRAESAGWSAAEWVMLRPEGWDPAAVRDGWADLAPAAAPLAQIIAGGPEAGAFDAGPPAGAQPDGGSQPAGGAAAGPLAPEPDPLFRQAGQWP
ncbi:hypothetical protein ACFFJB_06665 [Camelimonas abortus]|uniref:Uncharacterized protein n=1 Tax=Camelimonas abortus TaxID=1017184 RepID=A0ABV7LGH5_9HYPH